VIIETFRQPNPIFDVQVVVLWVVTSCLVVVGYQRFRGPCHYCG